ncbi:neuferricin [Nerophis lumbriciformis]|uniref:neuferricin n=1 Tax=Nerophis lumbriciformis TaxID=546530 RepID=UPI002ADF5DAB|nr:neuferricin-like isoform X1 [Nerophis lumbriciformis]
MLNYVFLSVSCACAAVLLCFYVGIKSTPSRLLSRQELSLYDGQEGSKGVYLAILGQVFDVQTGIKHYGPGGAYRFMAGKDSSLAFITGDFTENNLIDDVSTLSPLEVVALFDWLAFYRRTYSPVGLLVGRFYSESGVATEDLLRVEDMLKEGQQIKAKFEEQTRRFPACNSEWSPASGGRVWCSTNSGGLQRSWTGVPRKLFSPGARGVQCVCVKDTSAATKDLKLQEYEGCSTYAESCSLLEND